MPRAQIINSITYLHHESKQHARRTVTRDRASNTRATPRRTDNKIGGCNECGTVTPTGPLAITLHYSHQAHAPGHINHPGKLASSTRVSAPSRGAPNCIIRRIASCANEGTRAQSLTGVEQHHGAFKGTTPATARFLVCVIRNDTRKQHHTSQNKGRLPCSPRRPTVRDYLSTMEIYEMHRLRHRSRFALPFFGLSTLPSHFPFHRSHTT